MNESKLVSSLKKWLNSLPYCVCYKIHGNKFQESGIPDLIGCYYGKFFAIETKVGNNKTSPLQDYQLKRIDDAWGLAFIVTEKNVEIFKKEFYASFNSNDK